MEGGKVIITFQNKWLMVVTNCDYENFIVY